jgi:penicillin-binding protein A
MKQRIPDPLEVPPWLSAYGGRRNRRLRRRSSRRRSSGRSWLAGVVFVGALCAVLVVSRGSSSEAPAPGGDVDVPEVRAGVQGPPLAAPTPPPAVLLGPLPVLSPPAVPALVPATVSAPTPPSAKPTPPAVRVAPTEVATRLPAGRRDFDSLVGAKAEAPLRERLRIAAPNEAGEGTPAVRPEEAFEIEYTFDPELSRAVFAMLERGRVDLGHVIVADARSGRILTYASTDPRRFPPTRLYPAASLVKVLTAAAALPRSPDLARKDCVYSGSPYRLTPARVDPPRRGRPITFAKAMGQSNNQCFAQLAVHQLGSQRLLASIRSFGWLSSPAPGHPAGRANAGSSRYDLGMLGSGLSGTEITPLHALQMALTLSDGTVRHPYWIERVVDDRGELLSAPQLDVDEPRALSERDASRLRELMVETTLRGTARRAFRTRNGRPVLGDIKVAAKTGSLSGKNPPGHYDWFAAVAPADDPRVAIAVLTVRQRKWYQSSSQLGAQVLKQIFCPRGRCRVEAADDWLDVPAQAPSAAPDATGE